MSRSAINAYFHPAPSKEQAQACVQEMKIKMALLHKQFRRSKLEPFIPFICTYLNNTDASLQMICNALLAKHKLKINKSTLLRFIKSQPMFIWPRTNAMNPTCSNDGTIKL
jgi:hypothetical protein